MNQPTNVCCTRACRNPGGRALLRLSLLSAPVVGHAQQVPPGPPKPVAEATIHTLAVPRPSGWPVVSVLIQGQPVTVVLDLGSTNNVLSAAAGVQLSDDGQDSLVLGTSVEHAQSFRRFSGTFPVFAEGDVHPGLAPVSGLLGTSVLSHYDFVFDGPIRRVRLYPATSAATSDQGSTAAPRRPAWFPAGVLPADCTPMTPDPTDADRVFFALAVNGHSVHSMFDSGSWDTGMNLAAAAVAGLRPARWHLLPSDSAPQFTLYKGQKVWEVRGVPLTAGPRRFAAVPVHIYEHLPRETGPDDPELSLGLDAIHDRVFVVSYSTHQVCLGKPQRGVH